MPKGNKQGHNWAKETRFSQDKEFKAKVLKGIEEIGGVSALMKRLEKVKAYQTIYRYLNGGKAFEATENEIANALNIK